jgi:hypothetical protein
LPRAEAEAEAAAEAEAEAEGRHFVGREREGERLTWLEIPFVHAVMRQAGERGERAKARLDPRES